MANALEFRAVVKAFGPVRALSALSFTAPVGGVTVLLGPNGAGKTTTVRLTTGALLRDGGEIRVFGLDPSVDSHGGEIRRRCGVVPPKPAFYDRLTGRENLRFAARVFEAPEATVAAAAARFGIDDALDREVTGYSTGMRTRLALARAVLHDPDLLLLDEPTAGLDPESSRAVLDLVRDLAERGRTIVMCTHLLHEAEGIADRVVIIDGGTARAEGHPEELAARLLPLPVVVFEAEDPDMLDLLGAMPGIARVERNGAVRATLERIGDLPDLVAALVARGVRLTRVEPLRPTLEELYFAVRGPGGEDS